MEASINASITGSQVYGTSSAASKTSAAKATATFAGKMIRTLPKKTIKAALYIPRVIAGTIGAVGGGMLGGANGILTKGYKCLRGQKDLRPLSDYVTRPAKTGYKVLGGIATIAAALPATVIGGAIGLAAGVAGTIALSPFVLLENGLAGSNHIGHYVGDGMEMLTDAMDRLERKALATYTSTFVKEEEIVNGKKVERLVQRQVPNVVSGQNVYQDKQLGNNGWYDVYESKVELELSDGTHVTRFARGYLDGKTARAGMVFEVVTNKEGVKGNNSLVVGVIDSQLGESKSHEITLEGEIPKDVSEFIKTYTKAKIAEVVTYLEGSELNTEHLYVSDE